MNITRTLSLAAACMLLTATAFAQAATTATIAGAWNAQSMDGEGLPPGMTMTLDFGDNGEGTMTMKFEMDGEPPMNETEKFAWSIDADGILTIDPESEEDTFTFTTSIEDDTLTIISQDEDEPGTMILVRP